MTAIAEPYVGKPLALYRRGLTLHVTVVRMSSRYVWVGPCPGGNVRISRWTGLGQGACVREWTPRMTDAAETARWREAGSRWASALARYAEQAPIERAREIAERVGALLHELTGGDA